MAREAKRTRDLRRFGRPERLIDLLLDEKFACPGIVRRDEEAWDEYLQAARTALTFCEFAKVFDVQNIYEYAEAYKFGTSLDFRKDFASARLPFRSLFFEFRSVGRDRSTRNGILAMESDEAGGTRLITLMHFYGMEDGDDVFGPFALSYALSDRDGNIVEPPYTAIPWQPLLGTPWAEAKAEFAGGHQAPVVLLAISFMNCKNVATAEHEPDRQINRERRKAGLRPFVRHHTIDIEPMKRVLKTEGRVETEGLRRALHVCRGHFAHYTEEKPLFGKVAGTFWVPAHTRGSAQQGVVVSDYRFGAPAHEPASGPITRGGSS
jgi:hypothetical protein